MKPDRPSNTALVVAAGLQLAYAHAALPADTQRCGDRLLRRAYPRLAGLLRQGWFRQLCRLAERVTLPGICLHFALRKRLLRRHAWDAIAAGCKQVVVLGAGLDTLCLELKAAGTSLACIEIDHPATQAVKRAATGVKGVDFIAADLARQDVGALLAAHPDFYAGASTLFVAEGLLMYLPLSAVRALFARIAAVAPGCRVAFTWLEPLADGRPNFRRRSRLVDAWLRWHGEPFLSGVARPALAAFLAEAGFVLDHVNASGELLDNLDVRERPLEGEYVALALHDARMAAST